MWGSVSESSTVEPCRMYASQLNVSRFIVRLFGIIETDDRACQSQCLVEVVREPPPLDTCLVA